MWSFQYVRRNTYRNTACLRAVSNCWLKVQFVCIAYIHILLALYFYLWCCQIWALLIQKQQATGDSGYPTVSQARVCITTLNLLFYRPLEDQYSMLSWLKRSILSTMVLIFGWYPPVPLLARLRVAVTAEDWAKPRQAHWYRTRQTLATTCD